MIMVGCDDREISSIQEINRNSQTICRKQINSKIKAWFALQAFFPGGNNAQWSLLRQIDLSYIYDIKSDIWVCVVLINNCYAIDMHVPVTRNSPITWLHKVRSHSLVPRLLWYLKSRLMITVGETNSNLTVNPR